MQAEAVLAYLGHLFACIRGSSVLFRLALKLVLHGLFPNRIAGVTFTVEKKNDGKPSIPAPAIGSGAAGVHAQSRNNFSIH
jgi:hypothetical protein